MKILYFFISHAAEGFQSFNIHIMEFIKGANKISGINVIPGFPLIRSSKDLDVEITFFHKFKKNIPRIIKDILGILYNFIYLFKAIIKINHIKPDVILVRNNHNNFYNVILQKIYKIPLILEVNTPHTFERIKYKQLYFKRISLFIEKFGWKTADKIYTVSEYQKKMIVNYGISENKIVAIHNGVNLNLFKPPNKKIKKESSSLEILYVGSFRNYHGLSLIIDIIDQLYIKHPHIHVTIIGTGETYKQVYNLIKNLNLSECISLPGFIHYESIPRYLSNSDITFLSDFTEYGSPIKVFEYMAMKNAILVPDRKSILEILEHNKDALFFKAGNFEDFKNKMEQLIIDNKLRKKLAENAYKKVVNNYTWDHNAKKVIELLKEAIKDYHKTPNF